MSTFEDDDGIIDLNAMASRPAPARAPVAPLFSEPPPAISVDATDAAPAAKGRKVEAALLIGGGAFLVLGAIVALVFVFRGEKATPRTAATPPPPAVVAPPPPVTSAPAAEPPPALTSEASSEEDAKPAAKKKGSGKHASGSGAASKAASVPAKPAKAADPCHCHGDFQCNIRCSAGR